MKLYFFTESNGYLLILKGAKLTIQNEIQKSLIDNDEQIFHENALSVISEAYSSNSTVTLVAENKKSGETFTKSEESIYEKPIEVYDLTPVPDDPGEDSSCKNVLFYVFV